MRYQAQFQHPQTGWPVTARYSFGRMWVEVSDDMGDQCPAGDSATTHYVTEYDRATGTHDVISAHSSILAAWGACKAAQDAAGSVARFSVRDRGPASSRDAAGQAVRREVELQELRDQTRELVKPWHGRRFHSVSDADSGVREMSGQQVEWFDQD